MKYIKRPCCFLLAIYFSGMMLSILCGWINSEKKELYPPAPHDGHIEDGQDADIWGRVYKQEEKNEKLVLYLDQASIIIKNQIYSIQKTIVFTEDPPTIKLGNTIRAHGRIKYTEPASNPGQFDFRKYYLQDHIFYTMYKADISVASTEYSDILICREKAREQIQTQLYASLPDEEAGLLQAMILGDKTGIDTVIKGIYQKTGIAHILANICTIFLGVYNVYCVVKMIKTRTVYTFTFLFVYNVGILIWIFGEALT